MYECLQVADLPKPSLPGLLSSASTSTAAKVPEQQQQPLPEATPVNTTAASRETQRDTVEYPESDPWGSPALHRGHNHTSSAVNGSSTTTDIRSQAPTRTTSEFTTTSRPASHDNSSLRPDPTPTGPSSGIWGSYDGAPVESYNAPGDLTIASAGFGIPESDRPAPIIANRSFGGGRATGGAEEHVQITLLPEKEGMFMFQHHNYQVTSTRRGSKVVRRYSDFVWLLDCLQKRYPFRQIPLLPPKRVGGQ